MLLTRKGYRGWLLTSAASLVVLIAQAVPVSADGPPQSSAHVPIATDPTRPPQGPTVRKPPANGGTGHATDILVGRHQVQLKPALWLTYYKVVDETAWCCPVDLCGYYMEPTHSDAAVLMAGYEHDICDQLSIVTQSMVDFDIDWLASLQRKTVYRAELRYVEEPEVERSVGGGQMSVFNCATHLVPSNGSYWMWLAQTQSPGVHAMNSDAIQYFPLPLQDERAIDVAGGPVNLTSMVTRWLAFPNDNAGFALIGDTLSTDGDHDACYSKISNLTLTLDYEVLP